MGQAAEVIVEQLVLALVGLSAGAAVAGGLFSFIVELGFCRSDTHGRQIAFL